MSNLRWPDFLIIGAMKSGTTSLHDYLDKHPDIQMSNPKEIHFHNKHSILSQKDYLNNFNSDATLVGSSPQNYTKAHHKDFFGIPKKIHANIPNVKLIYIVRDPFKRMMSHALENRYGDSIRRIKFNEKSGHYWKTSLYFYQISKYLEFFNKKQIHVLSLESLVKNRLIELNKIFSFLNLSEMNDDSLFNYVLNDAASKSTPNFINYNLVYRIAHKISPMFAENIVISFIQIFLKSYLVKPSLNSLIDEEIASKIVEDTHKLRGEFDLNIEDWNLSPNL